MKHLEKLSTIKFLSLLFFVKLLAFGVASIYEALGFLFVIASISSVAVVDHLFPKRYDLHSQVDELTTKVDSLSSQVAALSMRSR